MNYKFSDLAGIIFGINTPEEDKLAIIRVIQEKCAEENREEFEFHQAYYAKQTGKIDAVLLSLIKMPKAKGKTSPKIAILGWGSLLWDESDAEFDERHHEWKFDGPVLKLEFARKSSSRLNALTLVIDAVIWTDLAGNFDAVPAAEFVKVAVNHVEQLTPEGKAKAAEYVWRAPDFIVTRLRSALQVEPWFKKP